MRAWKFGRAALAVLVATAGCAPAAEETAAQRPPVVPPSFVLFESPDAGYWAAYPQGWTPRPGRDPRSRNFASPDQRSFLLVDLLPRRFSDPELEEAGALFQVDAVGGTLPVRAPQQHRTNLNGGPAVELTAAYRIGSDDLTLRYYVFNRARRTWVTAYLGPTSRFADETKLFERFAQSFRLRPGVKLPDAAPRVGQPAPAFALEGTDGSRVHLADFQGHPLVLNFWATWCDCRVEIPLLNRLFQEASMQGIRIVGVNYGEDAGRVAAYRGELGIRFPVAFDRDKHTAAAYGVIGPPTTFFIDRHGVVRDIQVGLMSPERLTADAGKILKIL